MTRPTWGMLADLVSDRHGGVCGLDANGNVFAMDASLEQRWSTHVNLPLNRGSSLAVTSDGWLLAWSNQDHQGWVLSCETGVVADRFGCVEPPGSEPWLDLVKVSALACDPDGSTVLVFEGRLLRFGRDGRATELWPGVGLPRAALHAACEARPETDAHQWDVALRRRAIDASEAVPGFRWQDFEPTAMPSRPAAIGWNWFRGLGIDPTGALFVRMGKGSRHALARFDRRGERVYAKKLAVDAVLGSRSPAFDASGAAFVLGSHPNPRGSAYKVLVRISPDGASADEVVRDVGLGGTLSFEDVEQYALTTGGTLVVAGNHGRAVAVSVA